MDVTRRAFFATGGIAVLTLAGCSSDNESSENSNQSDQMVNEVEDTSPSDLVITESGWSSDENGYTYYGLGIQNPNDGFEAQYPKITISGKDADGNILFAENQTLFIIFPNETVYFGFQAGNGVAPSSVEFSITDCQWVDSEGLPENLFNISETTETDSGYGIVSFAGNITCNADVDTDKAPQFGQTAVTVILRNDSGQIIYGMSTFIDTPVKDVATPFEISAYSVPEHSSYEIYAQLW